MRVVLGGAVLLALAWSAGVLAPLALAVDLRRHRDRHPFPLIAAGEQHVSSSLAAIIVAAAPLFVALLALRFVDDERAQGSRLGGLLLGLAGVVALVGIDATASREELVAAGAVLLAAFCYAVGPMILKRKLADLDPRASMGGALAVAAVVLTPAALIAPPATAPSGEAIASLVVLGIFCTAAAFAFYGALVAETGPGRALVIYIAPVVAVALGIAILGERPGAGAAAGLLLILAGSWLATGGRMPPHWRLPVADRTRVGRLALGRARRSPAPPSHDRAAPAGAHDGG